MGREMRDQGHQHTAAGPEARDAAGIRASHGTDPHGHHPSAAVLTAYAAGSLGEGLSLLVATHLTLCPECREGVALMECAGGALLDDLEPIALAPNALDTVLARVDSPALAPSATAAPPRRPAHRSPRDLRRGNGAAFAPSEPLLPAPLRAALGADSLADVRWRSLGPGFRQVILPQRGRDKDTQVRILDIAGNRPLPHHGHTGDEFTLVLSGGFSDHMGHFVRGDVAEIDDDTDHQPLVDPEGCLCLLVTEAPLRYTGFFDRIVQRFTGL